MLKLACEYCRKDIDPKASRCPYCQGEYTPEQVARRSAEANKTAGIGCLGALAIIVGIWAWSSWSNSIPDEPTSTAKADIVATYQRVLAVAGTCDAGMQSLAASASGRDAVAAYQAAEQAERSCLDASGEMGKVDAPTSVGAKLHPDLVTALRSCEDSYILKWSAAKSMKEALDGGSKPSVLADMQRSIEGSQTEGLLCITGIASIASQLGVPPSEITGK